MAWSVPVLTGLYFLGGTLPPLLARLGANAESFYSMKLYSHSCHQLPERSFSVDGVQFAFCARCSGFFGGLFIACLFLQLRRRLSFPSWLWALILSLPILLDVSLDVGRLFRQPNLLRLTVGAVSSIGLASTFYPRWLAGLRRAGAG